MRAARDAAEVTAAVTLEQPQYQASELQISAALNGFRLAEVPTTMRDRGEHATATKKGGNFGYGVRFARAAHPHLVAGPQGGPQGCGPRRSSARRPGTGCRT